MGKPLSVDLRERVVAAVDGGLSRRKAADRFGVGNSSAIRWTSLRRRTGDVRPQRLGGDKRSGRIEGHGPLILSLVEAKADITLVELRAALAERASQWRSPRSGGSSSVTGSRSKKDRACGRAEPSGRPEPSSGLVPGLRRTGARTHAHGRRHCHHGQPARPQGAAVRKAIEAAGVELRLLPPYSPDLNPIENAFAKLKALLRAKAERTITALWNAVGSIIDLFTLAECINYFKAAGMNRIKTDLL